MKKLLVRYSIPLLVLFTMVVAAGCEIKEVPSPDEPEIIVFQTNTALSTLWNIFL